MRLSKSLLLSSVLACIWVAVPVRPQTAPMFVAEEHGRVARLIAEAKRVGKSRVQEGSPIGEYAVADSLETALKGTLPFVIRVDKKHSDVSLDGNWIRTWYQVTVIDNLTHASLPDPTAAYGPAAIPPKSFGPQSNDLLIIRTFGGEFSQDGVTVVSNESPVSFAVGRSYLVFIRFDDNRLGQFTRAATLLLGDAGAFELADDLLSPVDQYNNSLFVADLLSRSNSRLSTLKRDPALSSTR